MVRERKGLLVIVVVLVAACIHSVQVYALGATLHRQTLAIAQMLEDHALAIRALEAREMSDSLRLEVDRLAQQVEELRKQIGP